MAAVGTVLWLLFPVSCCVVSSSFSCAFLQCLGSSLACGTCLCRTWHTRTQVLSLSLTFFPASAPPCPIRPMARSGDEELLHQGPFKASPAAAESPPPSPQQQQQLSPHTSRGGSISAHTIVLPRGAGVSLTYAGVRAIEQLLTGMEAEFTVSFSPQHVAHITLSAQFLMIVY